MPEPNPPAPLPLRGRGAVGRPPGRFEATRRESAEADDDCWRVAADEDAADARALTTVRLEDARSAISRNNSPDIHFDMSVNPYRGCEHGCIYCYARPTHSYLGLSPGLDFETQIIAKRNIAERLACEIARPGHRPGSLVIGTVTDCYQPVERDLKLTRAVIEVLVRSRHPFGLLTKSSGVERDLDLIAPMADAGRAAVYVTITTLDDELARRLEPRAAAPWRRLRTIRTLAQAGVPVGVSVAPQIPFLNDDMEAVLAAAREAGARRAFYSVLRLPWELKDVFHQWLLAHYPLRADRVMARVQDLHVAGGRDRARGRVYDAQWGRRFTGGGVWAELIRQRFERACARLGFVHDRFPLDVSGFQPDAAVSSQQGRLF